jgi:hypothetical protein
MSAITVVGLGIALAISGGTVGIGAIAAGLMSRIRGRPFAQVRPTTVTASTPFVDVNALKEALADLEVGCKDILDQTPVSKGITVQARALPWSKQAVRFERGAGGKFKVIAKGCPAASVERWLKELVPRYAYHVTLAKLGEQGFDLVSEETQAEGRIHLKLRRVT